MFRNKDYVYCVYKEQSFRKASEQLHVSQPALSAMIKRVESEAGAPIFNRKTNPLSLTPFGVEYIKSIEVVNSLEEHLRHMTYELDSLLGGTLSICAHNLSTDYFIPRLIADFQKQYPNIRLSIIGTNTLRSKRMLDSGEIDLFFSSQPLDEREYEKIPVSQELLMLLVPRDFPVNMEFKSCAITRRHLKHVFSPAITGVSLRHFSNLPFILSNPENYLRTCTDLLFREAGFDPEIILEVEESGIAPNLAKHGIGATICSNILIEGLNFEKNFCLYKIDSTFAIRQSYLYHRRGAYITPAMKEFLEMIRR